MRFIKWSVVTMKAKSFDRKKELQEAALSEFIEKSFDEASLNNIIKNAGISKGTFYYHFRDKEALYLSLLQDAVDAKLEFLERKLKNYIRDENLNVFENLKLQAKFGVEFAKEHPDYYLLGLMLYREKGNKIYDTAMKMFDMTADSYYENLLEKAMEQGDFRDGVSIEFVKKIITHLLFRYDEIFGLKREDIDFDRLLPGFDELIDFMQHGLGKAEGKGK